MHHLQQRDRTCEASLRELSIRPLDWFCRSLRFAVCTGRYRLRRYVANAEKNASRDAVLCASTRGLPRLLGATIRETGPLSMSIFCTRPNRGLHFADPTKVKFSHSMLTNASRNYRSRKVACLAQYYVGLCRANELRLHSRARSRYSYDGQDSSSQSRAKKEKGREAPWSSMAPRSCVRRPRPELNLADYFRANDQVREINFALWMTSFKAYRPGNADVLTIDVSRLSRCRAQAFAASEHVILPDFISKEPLSPVVRQR